MKIRFLIACILMSLSIQPSFSDPVDDDPDEILAERGNKAAQNRLRIKREKAEEEQQKRAAAYAAQKQAEEEKARTAALQQAQIKAQESQQQELKAAQKQEADSDRETLNGLIDLGSRVGSLIR